LTHSFRGLSLWLVNLLLWACHGVGIKDPVVLKTDTQETENLDKAISLDREGCKNVLTPAKQHASTKWLTVAPPSSLTQLYLPLTWDLSRSKVHSLSPLAERLGGGGS
jgi:hypothetical protein